MGEFMSNESLAFYGLWSILSCAKYYIVPHCIRQRIDRPRGLRRLHICMHAHIAKVMPKARLHESARLCI